MNRPTLPRPLAALLALLPAVLASTASSAAPPEPSWKKLSPGVYELPSAPRAYALVAENRALVIGAPSQLDPHTPPPGAEKFELALLTHAHRDTAAGAATFVEANIPVRAPLKSADKLSPDGVARFWKQAMPEETPGRFPPLFERFWNNWSYLVLPVGIEGIQCDLRDGDAISWRGWSIQVVAAPGHTPDHVAYLAARANQTDAADQTICFCGDAFCSPGKFWSPYTAEWHHQKDEGLAAAGLSLRKLSSLKPDLLCPEHGPPLSKDVSAALLETADLLEQAARLKNFVDFNHDAPGEPPRYRFLAPDQVGTANPSGNPKPWTLLSPHLFLTGNIYALASKDGPVLLMDPYSRDVADHLRELKRKYGFGPLEVALISHAHNDHYTGLFALPNRESYQVWTLDRIADVVSDPWRFRAPYVDPRRVKVDRELKDGETVQWREYELTFHHQPGQTEFAMSVEVTVDGRKCLFTGDNFYHVDQYSGNGGWSGRNRGLPAGYAASAQQVLEIQPDWILAEHGGAFEFHPEDFRRRVNWAASAVAIADKLSPFGRHACDWDPHRVRVEPLLQQVRPGAAAQVTLVAANPLDRPETLSVHIPGRGFFPDVRRKLTIAANATQRISLSLPLQAGALPGRHVFPAQVDRNGEPIAADVFLVLSLLPAEAP